MGRRFRSLKLWFVLRAYGQEKLQGFLRCTTPVLLYSLTFFHRSFLSLKHVTLHQEFRRRTCTSSS